jgi:hypothetical protein
MIINFLAHFIALAEVNRLFFLNERLFLVIDALINGDIHFFNENAISGYTISLVDINNVTYH